MGLDLCMTVMHIHGLPQDTCCWDAFVYFMWCFTFVLVAHVIARTTKLCDYSWRWDSLWVACWLQLDIGSTQESSRVIMPMNLQITRCITLDIPSLWLDSRLCGHLMLEWTI